ncbi:uncharacterized protein BX664DRAFT_387099 [Halteromyces radiatus]|uniref:uncharacterized protein n=1 Tax=Halteromyces radiatus TaxID=101107 RepID=UPI00221F95F3|nr:uncharacterized protein BX664DRAFT_387099 [Halteromyces radiatus]KAI8086731.1 hypothetical protein BX664DRAFT_387099 [Halteromyces radiatus]
MSLAGYLFGNVDEQGRLDNDLDEELKQTLQHVDANVFSQIFNPDTFGIQTSHNQTGSDLDDDDDMTNGQQEEEETAIHVVPMTQHAATAIDYSDFDETVPDDSPTKNNTPYLPRPRNSIPSKLSKMPVSRMKKNPVSKSITRRYLEEEDDDYDTQEPPILPSITTTMSSSPLSQLSTPLPKSSSPSYLSSLPESVTNNAAMDITQLFPAFERGKVLKFSDLFMTRIKRRTKIQTPLDHMYMGDGFNYVMAADQQNIFLHQPYKRRKLDISKNDQDDSDDDDLEQRHQSTTTKGLHQQRYLGMDNHLYHAIMLEPWEKEILWDDPEPTRLRATGELARSNAAVMTAITTTNKGRIKRTTFGDSILNHDLENGDWLESVIWDDEGDDKTTKSTTTSTDRSRLDPDSIKVILDLNDPHMLFDAESMEDSQQQLLPIKHVVKKGRKPNPRPIPKMPLIYTSDPDSRSKLPQSRFNISNDRHYDMNFAVVRVRQTHGQLVVQHSIPALQLHRTLYKTKMTKSELRSFHRPLFQFPVNTDISFTRVRLMKKKQKNKKPSSANGTNVNGSTADDDAIMRTTKDLTLKDTSSFVLLEYSEEHPPIISNVGMGTLIVNYYRKTDPKDDHIPHMDIGEPFVLEVEDTSPFMTFGNVEPGQTIPVMYNNMVRAPLFSHQVRHTDFLLVRSTYHGQSRYYLREIPALYVMGQTYPVQEVPGPQSRRVTTTVKNRLQIVAYRLLAKHPQHRLKMSKLASRFPEYQDIQVRQRLKEFLEFNRHSKDKGGGYWKVRPSKETGERHPPTEDQLRLMCTPEMVCLYESMLVGERHLQDLGYSNINDTVDQDDNSTSQLETEQQLAPWFATRNFINACQGKAMLKLSGDGDPTGCGEGFSFIRVSMKDIFLRAGESAEMKLAQIKSRPKSAHRYNVAEQQQVYKEEIERIWNAQWNALSQTEEPDYTPQDNMDDSSADERELDQINSPMTPDHMEWRHQRRYDRANSEGYYDDMDDNISVTESYSSQAQHRNRELKITRQMRQENGEIKPVVEIVRDPAVIKAYIAQRQLIIENTADLEAIDPTNSHEKNARMKKQTQQQLAKLKKMTERRRQRQLSKTAALAENPVLGLMRGKREGAMRRCGNCGQLGHMKTNKSCPNFPDKNNNNNKDTLPDQDVDEGRNPTSTSPASQSVLPFPPL